MDLIQLFEAQLAVLVVQALLEAQADISEFECLRVGELGLVHELLHAADHLQDFCQQHPFLVLHVGGAELNGEFVLIGCVYFDSWLYG